uniref:BPTI/Kunitz inhibitor domain-containing protein n=1 Tax=Heterorhabditis bacteriophora TaxID=37862 RepID=A0A1I7WSI6_HETBA
MSFYFIVLLHQCFSAIDTLKYHDIPEYCPNQSSPGKSPSGDTIWCTSKAACSTNWECIPSGLTHFGTSINYCCQTRESICSLPPNPGYGDCTVEPKTKYYFDLLELKCKPFQFFECIGQNQNKFETVQECYKFCQSTACSEGQSLLLASNNNPFICAGNSTCPDGYKCVYDALFRRHVCCGHSKDGSCPIESIPFFSPRSFTPLRCKDSSTTDHCPPNYLCSIRNREGFCCKPYGGLCPIGQKAYTHPLSGQSMKCDPMRVISECPQDHICTSVIPAECPTNTEPYLDPITRNPHKCTVGVTTCSYGYTCQSTRDEIIGFCCSVSKSGLKSYLNKIIGAKMRKTNDAYKYYTSSSDLSFIRPSEIMNDFKPEKRIVDIQKQIDKSAEATITPSRSSQLETLSLSSPSCPEDARPQYFDGTQLTMECTPAIGLTNKCGKLAKCVAAPKDIFRRFVCCFFSDDITTTLSTTTALREMYPERRAGRVHNYQDYEDSFMNSPYVYTVTSKPIQIATEYSSDPYCPSVISGRTCRPGLSDQCPEYDYFCQYNIEKNTFVCCSMTVAQHR